MGKLQLTIYLFAHDKYVIFPPILVVGAGERNKMYRWEDPRWTNAMRITLDFNNMMVHSIGEGHGLTDQDINALEDTAKDIHNELMERRKKGELQFYELPYQEEMALRIKEYTENMKTRFENLVILGIGGSALGGKALHRALNHPYYNLLSKRERGGYPRIFFKDNIDPDWFGGLFDVLDLKKTAFHVISKSGETSETMSQFLIICEKLRHVFGEKGYKDHIVVTTDPQKGALREIIKREDYLDFPIPRAIGGRFSVLTPVGLLPAAACGIDIHEILAGARYMDQRCNIPTLWENPAYMNGALQYLSYTKNKTISVMMPYSAHLKDVANWFCQIWAESLGKKYAIDGARVHVGPTPVKALGVTDQHSQLQLYIEGPFDKVITFLVVRNHSREMPIPKLYSDIKDISHLGNHSLNQLFCAEGIATELALTKNERSNCSIILAEINPFTIGQLLFLFEVQTVFTGWLFRINPLDQPGVEDGKKLTYGLMGRSGFEHKRKEAEEGLLKKQKRYMV